ncbi:MAG: endonuclease/exonuclease/phosphatase family protein [Rhodothermia bacterium]
MERSKLNWITGYIWGIADHVLRNVCIVGVLLAPSVLLVAGCAGSNNRVQQPEAATQAETRPGPDTLRILAYNIHAGVGMDKEIDLERLAALIRAVNPDLVALQEVDSVTSRTNSVDQAAELGRLTGLESVFGRFMPYQGGAYGMALLSRWPIVESQNLRLPDGAEPRTALTAIVRSPATGQILRFAGIHFYKTDEERMAQVEQLEAFLRADEVPTILAGDFNSTPDSEVMNHLAESWTVIEKGDEHLTFPSYAPDREIDFVLFRPEGQFEMLDQYLVDEPVASDHRPVVVDLVLQTPG